MRTTKNINSLKFYFVPDKIEMRFEMRSVEMRFSYFDIITFLPFSVQIAVDFFAKVDMRKGKSKRSKVSMLKMAASV